MSGLAKAPGSRSAANERLPWWRTAKLKTSPGLGKGVGRSEGGTEKSLSQELEQSVGARKRSSRPCLLMRFTAPARVAPGAEAELVRVEDDVPVVEGEAGAVLAAAMGHVVEAVAHGDREQAHLVESRRELRKKSSSWMVCLLGSRARLGRPTQ